MMMLIDELITLLHEYIADEPSYDEAFIEDVAIAIYKGMKNHPLPSFAQLRDNSETAPLLRRILRRSYEQRNVYQREKAALDSLTKRLYRELSLLKSNINQYDQSFQQLSTIILQKNAINVLLKQFIDNKSLLYTDFTSLKFEMLISKDSLFLEKITEDGLSQEKTAIFERINCINKGLEYLNRAAMNRLPEKLKNISLDMSLLNELKKHVLRVHTQRCTRELDAQTIPLHMIHFYRTTPHASEFLEAFDSDDEGDESLSFEHTNHGLGSGVYGLARLTEEDICISLEEKNNFEIVEIRAPFFLNDKESDDLTEISKALQRMCDDIKSLYMLTKKEREISREDAIFLYFTKESCVLALQEHANALSQFTALQHWKKDQLYDLLHRAISEFFIQANKKKSVLVAMPINYVIKALGYTGIVSRLNDRFNRGLIVFDAVIDGEPLRQQAVKLSRSRSVSNSSDRSISIKTTFSSDSLGAEILWLSASSPLTLPASGALFKAGMWSGTELSPSGDFRSTDFRSTAQSGRFSTSCMSFSGTFSGTFFSIGGSLASQKSPRHQSRSMTDLTLKAENKLTKEPKDRSAVKNGMS